MKKEDIIKCMEMLYASYGSDSGVLFGIDRKETVKLIVQFACNHGYSIGFSEGVKVGQKHMAKAQEMIYNSLTGQGKVQKG